MRKPLSSKAITIASKAFFIGVGVILAVWSFWAFEENGARIIGLCGAVPLFLIGYKQHHVEFDENKLFVRRFSKTIEVPLRDVEHVDSWWIKLKKDYGAGRLILYMANINKLPVTSQPFIGGAPNYRIANELAAAVKKAHGNNRAA